MAEKNECTSCSNDCKECGSVDKGCSCDYADKSCGCVGYAYVPVQKMCSLYDNDTALKKGTLFPSLDLSICEYGNTCREMGGIING